MHQQQCGTDLSIVEPFGWLYLNLNVGVDTVTGDVDFGSAGTLAQSYVAAAHSASGLYQVINGHFRDHIDADIIERAALPPPVPCTSIYTKSDGIVPWQCSLNSEAPQTENVRVYGSHCGLGHNPSAIWAIMDRLALPEDNWSPFDRRQHRLWAFPRPDQFYAS